MIHTYKTNGFNNSYIPYDRSMRRFFQDTHNDTVGESSKLLCVGIILQTSHTQNKQ